MAEASMQQFKVQGEQAQLAGELTFDTVAALYSPLQQWIQQAVHSCLQLDFSAVTTTDSAGLALIIESQRLAKLRAVELQYKALPEQLLTYASVAGVAELLGFK